MGADEAARHGSPGTSARHHRPRPHRERGRGALATMKRGAYLINASRGPIVDEEALCDALDSGLLRGAGLDVYEHEPEANARLLTMKNVVILPHIGSATDEARTAMASIAATDISRFLQGQPPLHPVGLPA